MMGSQYPNLVRGKCSSNIHLVTSVSPGDSVFECVTASPGFVHLCMPGGFRAWSKVELFGIHSWHCPRCYEKSLRGFRDLEVSCILYILTGPAFAYFSNYVLKHHTCKDLV